MLKFILRRTMLAVPTVLGASLFSFIMIYLVPGNPAQFILKEQLGYDPSVEEVLSFLQRYGLGTPVLLQSWYWLQSVGQGNLGVSLRTGEPVLVEFLDRFPATLELALVAMVLSLLIAFPLGTMSALRRNSFLDHVSRLTALWGVSMPGFWLGLLLIYFFSLKLKLLPCFGSGGIQYIVLPAVTLSMSITASITRLVRASTLEVLHQKYVRTARAKGLIEAMVVWKHVVRNTLIPVVTVIGLQIGHLLAGAVVVETVFAWPGIGKFLVESIYARDYPVIQGFALIIALIFVAVNGCVDILYMFLNPRLRHWVGER
jgi:peptide/nickel transport system permease protein